MNIKDKKTSSLQLDTPPPPPILAENVGSTKITGEYMLHASLNIEASTSSNIVNTTRTQEIAAFGRYWQCCQEHSEARLWTNTNDSCNTFVAKPRPTCCRAG